jgi:16S rRNA (uracil1498-N3)-methyltransferase
MPDRYYCSEEITPHSPVTLDRSEAHHLLHVMRAQPGLALIVFDGRGGQFTAEVTQVGRATVELTVGERQEVERELPCELTLAVALPKGDRQRWLIEKCTELGVTRLIPLQTEHSVAKSENAAKLSRYVIEASKQSGRNRLMEIAPPMRFSDLLEEETSGERLLSHPGGKPLGSLNLAAGASRLVAVGPEGGFSEEEFQQAVATGWVAVGLGPRILRIETAAVVLASALSLD